MKLWLWNKADELTQAVKRRIIPWCVQSSQVLRFFDACFPWTFATYLLIASMKVVTSLGSLRNDMLVLAPSKPKGVQTKNAIQLKGWLHAHRCMRDDWMNKVGNVLGGAGINRAVNLPTEYLSKPCNVPRRIQPTFSFDRLSSWYTWPEGHEVWWEAGQESTNQDMIGTIAAIWGRGGPEYEPLGIYLEVLL